MKRILAIMLVIMMLSVSAMAEGVSAGNVSVTGNSVTTDGTNVTGSGVMAGDTNVIAPAPGLISEAPRPQTKEAVRKRIEAYKAEYVTAKERLVAAKERYRNAVEVYKGKKEDYLALKTRYENASEADKAAIKTQLKNSARMTLAEQADSLIKKLYELEGQGIAPEGFEETIVQLEEIKENLEDENASRDEIIEALQDIRDTIIPQIKERTQLRAANALDNKLEAVMNRSGNTVEKMNTLVTNLQEKGIDTEDLEAAIVEFESDMADAEAKHAEAKAKWAEAETAEDKHAVLKEGFVIAKEVNRILIEGHQGLKAALVQVREQARTASQTSTGSDNSDDENIIVGGDADENGCIGSAGYQWCSSTEKCQRMWEEYCEEYSDQYTGDSNTE